MLECKKRMMRELALPHYRSLGSGGTGVFGSHTPYMYTNIKCNEGSMFREQLYRWREGTSGVQMRLQKRPGAALQIVCDNASRGRTSLNSSKTCQDMSQKLPKGNSAVTTAI